MTIKTLETNSNVKSNPTSRRVKEKTGARYIGTRIHENVHSEDNEVEAWEVTRDSWAKLRGRTKQV